MTNTIRGFFLLVVLLIASCKGDSTTGPPATRLQISSVVPNKLSIAAQLINIEVLGTGFINVSQISAGSGVKILSQEVLDSQRIKLVMNVSKTAQPGARDLTVTANGQTAQLAGAFTIQKNPAPSAKFEFTPEIGSVNTTYTFDASSTIDDGSIDSFTWDFGDGSSKNGARVNHRFQHPGSFTVRLVVTDNRGGASAAQQEIEVLENVKPVASFVVDPAVGTQETHFTFDASSSSDADGQIVKYHWEFGDAAANGMTVRHRFQESGSYKVELTVTDSDRTTAVEKKTVRVEFFDREKAIRQIDEVLKDFLILFGRIEELSAEEIVLGFSQNPICRGRQREIEIINKEKPEIQEAAVQITDDSVVTKLTQQSANADLRARFYGTRSDSTTYDGFSTHHFTLLNEEAGWKICNFTVTHESGSSAVIFHEQ